MSHKIWDMVKICECPYTVSDIKDFLKLFCKSFNQIKINYLKVFTNCHVSWDTLYHRFKLSCIQHAFDPWHFIHVIAGVVINNINNPPPLFTPLPFDQNYVIKWFLQVYIFYEIIFFTCIDIIDFSTNLYKNIQFSISFFSFRTWKVKLVIKVV